MIVNSKGKWYLICDETQEIMGIHDQKVDAMRQEIRILINLAKKEKEMEKDKYGMKHERMEDMSKMDMDMKKKKSMSSPGYKVPAECSIEQLYKKVKAQ